MKQNKTRPTQGSGATYLDGITPIQKHQGYRWLDQLFQKIITKNQSFGACYSRLWPILLALQIGSRGRLVSR